MEKAKPLKTLFREYFDRAFLNPSTLSKETTIYTLVLELTIFCGLVNFGCLDNAQAYFQCPPYTGILVNTAVLAVRIITGASIIKPLYLLSVLITPQISVGDKGQYQASEVFFWVNISILVINMLIDALSHVDFSFLSENPYSETHNTNKILHNFCMMTISVILVLSNPKGDKKSSTEFVFHSISCALFVLLAICKARSHCKNRFVKDILLRFYFLCAFFELIKIVTATSSL